MAYFHVLGITILSCLTGVCLAQVQGMFCQNIDSLSVLEWCENQCCGDPKHQYCCTEELQTGAIVGIVFGVIGFIILVVVVVLLMYFCWYKRRDSDYKESNTFARYSGVRTREEPPPKVQKDFNSPEYEPKAVIVSETKAPPPSNDYEPYKTKAPPRNDDYDDEDDDDFDDYDEYDDYKTEPRGGRPGDRRRTTRRYDDDAPDGGGYMTELKGKLKDRDSKYRYDEDDDGNGRPEPRRERHDEYRGPQQGFRGYKHSQSSV